MAENKNRSDLCAGGKNAFCMSWELFGLNTVYSRLVLKWNFNSFTEVSRIQIFKKGLFVILVFSVPEPNTRNVPSITTIFNTHFSCFSLKANQ